MAHRAKNQLQAQRDLSRVVTAKTAAELAHVTVKTIYWHIDNNNVASVQDGRIWLISVRSLKALYPEMKLDFSV